MDDVYLGNGVSELITMSLQALLNNGDEVLIPAPDYPLWTASVSLAGGHPVHYLCVEEEGWLPDLEDMERKITPNTKGIVIINPNNPTGAVYPQHTLKKMLALARKHNLVVFADEIYEKILYEDAVHVNLAADRRRCPVPDLQRAVQGLPGLRFPGRLDGHLRAEAFGRGLHRRHQPAHQHAPVRQRSGPACHPDRARRPPEHQRPDPARRPAAGAAQQGL